MPTSTSIRVGTAGWGIPKGFGATLQSQGTQLERYGRMLGAVEINSSFYRSHLRSTYERWASAVPQTFRFAVKVPKTITHTARLRTVNDPLDAFLAQVAGLGDKLGPLLVQLPPSLAFDPVTAEGFFTEMRLRVTGAVVCEPRHPSWFTPNAEGLLAAFRIGRVGADPPPVPQANKPGGWPRVIYLRLHGSPRIYYSAYDDEMIQNMVKFLQVKVDGGNECWCIFDNTASGAAMANALAANNEVNGC